LYKCGYNPSRALVRANGSSAGTSSPVNLPAARRYIARCCSGPALAVNCATKRQDSRVLQHLGQIQRLGGLGHHRAPIAFEFSGFFRDQRGAHVSRRSVGERRPDSAVPGFGRQCGTHVHTIAADGDGATKAAR